MAAATAAAAASTTASAPSASSTAASQSQSPSQERVNSSAQSGSSAGFERIFSKSTTTEKDHNASNSSPPPQSLSAAQQQQQAHRRGYHACDPCRRRKVKCDLGSVDNPHPPPCVRCRRESKVCHFSETRRKARSGNGYDDETADEDAHRDKRRSAAPSESLLHAASINATATLADSSPYQIHTSPGQRWSSLGRPRRGSSLNSGTTDAQADPRASYPSFVRNIPYTRESHSGQHMMNKTAADLLSPAISNSHDALHLLSEAAGRSEDLQRQLYGNLPRQRSPSTTFTATPGSSTGQAGAPGATGQPAAADPQHTQRDQPGDADTSPEEQDITNALKSWARLRFVRAGWFSEQEAMDYVIYYYKYLQPLTPIVIPDFSTPSTHLTLLTEEPILTVTILTIASRYMKLSGPGAYSRAYSIHEKLWSYLHGMIERLLWGQEQFGGGNTALGNIGIRDLNNLNTITWKGTLRSLGTVEALLLLTDWHPRALHFPPGDDENTLLDMDPHEVRENEANQPKIGRPSENRMAFANWLEPAWRSDRMCWMLLGTAQALAFELGVFDKKHGSRSGRNAGDSHAHCIRKRRCRKLILVYVTQNSGRLGIESMLPLEEWKDSLMATCDHAPYTMTKHDIAVENMVSCWADIADVMAKTNNWLFPSKNYTRELVKSGRYREEIDHFNPVLEWYLDKTESLTLSPHMKHILVIEFEYTKLYVNSLALQAVVEKWTHISNENEASENVDTPGAKGVGAAAAGSGAVPFSVLMELYRGNEKYIREVADASRRILTTVVDGLVPGDFLKHCPVRTYFRILSGMIFLLKTFALGAKENDVRISLDLLDRTIEAMRTCVVDDVHLSIQMGDLVKLLTSSIRTRFLRFAATERGGDAESQTHTPLQGSRSHTPANFETNNADSKMDTSGANTMWQTPARPSAYQNAVSAYGSDTPNSSDPLAGIPAQPINSSNLNVSFMPPPDSHFHNYQEQANNNMDGMDTSAGQNAVYDPTASNAVNPGGAASAGNNMPNNNGNNNNPPDWFALPLDPFFNSAASTVDQGFGGIGPVVGDFDMLEVLLNEQYDASLGGGPGPGPAGAQSSGGGQMGGFLSGGF